MICTRSLGTVVFAGFFVGAILVVQFEVMLARYDAQALLGGLNTSALLREVGPLIISFLIAGKIGAYTAAELGTMKVTEQIDAIRCLGHDPLETLIFPRFLGIITSSLILLMIGLAVALLGSIGIAQTLYGINPLLFLSSVPKFSSLFTLFCGIFKCLCYGAIVASVACYQGYQTSGGARGVGIAVTRASLYTNFYIVLANYLISTGLELVGRFL
jgi:phospholipid/cholesterol/gamma-HCH transport system permease protein